MMANDVGSGDLRGLVERPGANDVPYEDPYLPGRPLLLRAARPHRYAPDTPVLFVHHGVRRNGGDYRDYWLPLVDAAQLLVIVPEFSSSAFPEAAWYNFGNRVDEDGRPKPRTEWTYGVPERVFAALRQQGVTSARRYGSFGHSAADSSSIAWSRSAFAIASAWRRPRMPEPMRCPTAASPSRTVSATQTSMTRHCARCSPSG